MFKSLFLFNLSISNFNLAESVSNELHTLFHVALDIQANLGEGFIAMENIPTPNGAIRLSSPNSIEQYAKELYAALRAGDRRRITKIVVIQPGGTGLAESIRDRLRKMRLSKINASGKFFIA